MVHPAPNRPWTLWVAAALLPGLLMCQEPFAQLIQRQRFGIILCAIAPLTLLGCAALWIHGLGNAGKGWRRVLFLTAFAASLGSLGTEASSFASGFLAGSREGLNETVTLLETKAQPSRGGLGDWLLLSAVLGVLLHRLEKYRSEATRQRGLAAEAQNAVLQAKLAPHFIFNCLNTLKAQISSDPAGAEATTDRLASLFRQVVELSGRASHPLREELHFVETYLGIEKARLGARLQVEILIPEALEGCPLPPLALQVLVENAVKHGVGSQEAGGLIQISAEQAAQVLTLRVTDPGPGLSAQRGTGTALETLRLRLGQRGDLQLAMVDSRHCASLRWVG